MMKVAITLKGDINYDARVQKTINSLINRGFEVTLVAWNWSPIVYSHPGLNIIELNISGYKMPTNPFTAYLLSIIYYILASRVIRSIKCDYCHFNDLNTFVISLFLGKNAGARYIYDAHELLPEGEDTRMKKFIWNILEKLTINKADIIITPEINRALYMQKKYKLKKTPVVINNFPVYTKTDREFAVGLKKRTGLSDRKIIVYEGKIEKGRFIKEMVLCLDYLSEDYVLLLVGGILQTYKEHIVQVARKHNLSQRVLFYGRVEPKNMIDVLSAADIGLAFYGKDTLNTYYCAPNKIFDYIMAGLCVVTNTTPALDMVKDMQSVAMIENINPRAVSEAVLAVAGKKEHITEETKKAFSWDRLENKIGEIYLRPQ